MYPPAELPTASSFRSALIQHGPQASANAPLLETMAVPGRGVCLARNRQALLSLQPQAYAVILSDVRKSGPLAPNRGGGLRGGNTSNSLFFPKYLKHFCINSRLALPILS